MDTTIKIEDVTVIILMDKRIYAECAAYTFCCVADIAGYEARVVILETLEKYKSAHTNKIAKWLMKLGWPSLAVIKQQLLDTKPQL